ncbi:Phospholipase A1 precursor [Thiorhodovibrio winogradskyi]|uniref:Phospholipase A1 n=1 Tax=Thiorhodovibrio winogradskyi TaxID=77007 RepID=A0ABZ0SDM9_9GAMM|nr:phospholipase A [Thiorhodovibrio winogradskyi]
MSGSIRLRKTILASSLLSLLSVVLPSRADEARATTGLANCARIANADVRLQCFDALAARGNRVGDGPLEPTRQSSPPVARDADSTQALDLASATDARVAEPLAPQPRPSLSLLPYRKNYILPVSYNANVNENLPREPTLDLPLFGEGVFDNVEMKFQLSFEVPLWTRLLNRPLDLYFGYTQLAFFQAYNQEYSSPFRETNYEPEFGLHWRPDLRLGLAGSRWRLTSVRAAANHQSNGRSEPLSRSWNRITGEASVERENLSLGLRLWTLLGNRPANNPDITDYLGYGELRGQYDGDRHRFGLMVRNPSRPTVQLDWSYPLNQRVRVYAQYFNGYGESLADYNHSVNRIGVGFMLEDGG